MAYLGTKPSNQTPTYKLKSEFVATAGQTVFAPSAYTPGYIDVYRNGVKLGNADFTATNGTTVTLANGASVGDLITFESVYLASIQNGIPATAGAVSTSLIADNAVTAAKIADANITAAKMGANGTWAPAGTVLQVVSAAKTNTFSTTAGQGSPATITGLSASITPSSSSNKVLITVNIGEIGADGDTTWAAVLYRNGTAICLGTNPGTGQSQASVAGGIPAGGESWRGVTTSITFLDTPATTSACTYTVRLGGNGVSILTVNYDYRNSTNPNDASRVPSTITLMEIAG